MNHLIGDCIEEIRKRYEINGAVDHEVQTPKNPSIIVDYNMDPKEVEQYNFFLEQSWPSASVNIPRAEKGSNFFEKMNKLRNNHTYKIFTVIHIHVLVNLTTCCLEELKDFLNDNFNESGYKIVLHEFMDYKDESLIESCEGNLLTAIKNFEKVQCQFIYSNRLSNGAMWIGEDESRFRRLAANITAIMSIDERYFTENIYTFSYNLLEKPIKMIVQFTISRLLENACHCQIQDKCDTDLLKKYTERIQCEVNRSIGRCLFEEKEFEYLPDNQKLKKEKKKTKKGILSLEKEYPVTKMCFTAMIDQKVKQMSKTLEKRHVDFSDDLSDPLIAYCVVDGYWKEEHHEKVFLDDLKESLLHYERISDEGTYNKILTEYANQEIKKAITKRILEDFSKQFHTKLQQVRDVYQCLSYYLENPVLRQVYAIGNEENIINYYGELIDNYFYRNQNKIIAKLIASDSKKDDSTDADSIDGLLRGRLLSIMRDLFDDQPVYYMPFEDEVDERTGKDTAKSMFDTINKDDSVDKNICINWENLQFELDQQITNEVILLMNPKSKLLEIEFPGNYHPLFLSRQDCVERIELRVLSLKPEQEGENEN